MIAPRALPAFLFVAGVLGCGCGYAQAMVAHCFRTVLDEGSCEVIDTGFATR